MHVNNSILNYVLDDKKYWCLIKLESLSDTNIPVCLYAVLYLMISFASLIFVPIILGCIISPWIFLSLIFIFPLLVTILIRLDW